MPYKSLIVLFIWTILAAGAAYGQVHLISDQVRPDALARAALFLASDQSDGITGQILPVDAGLP
jgi:enoyl-[acyl-carrier-protein] reductase (NADH)